ncbi:MAG: uracil-DNA glycosylase [Akkermansiaceae bacterium]|nr:uracil-DNA glycosylase [Armatimonadota bacterium]
MLELINADAPYALKSPHERERRAAMLTTPSLKPLGEYLDVIRRERGPEYAIPNFDPCDGGSDARVLFLLEAPGPKAVVSSFVSRNNPDPTARNLCELLSGAGIARRDTLIWNIVPWYVGDGQGRIRPVNPADIRAALPYLDGLLKRLPNLMRIVLVGLKAQSAAKSIRALTPVPFFATPHPSGQVFNVRPDKRAEAEDTVREIALLLNAPESD